MEESNVEKLYKMLESIPVTEENEKLLEKIKNDLDEKDYENALNGLRELGNFKAKEKKGKGEKRGEKIVGTTGISRRTKSSALGIESSEPGRVPEVRL